MLTRRTFLTTTAGALAGGAARTLPRWPRPLPGLAPERVLVVIQLQGGNDGLNTLVPHEDDAYHRARPDIALPRKGLHRLDELHALHSSLTGLARWYERGSVAVVRGVGYDDQNLSHFESEDNWHTASPGRRGTRTGWLGRYRDVVIEADRPGSSPLALLAVDRGSSPLSMRSGERVAPVVADLRSFRFLGSDLPATREARIEAIRALNAVGADSGGGGLPEPEEILQAAAEQARRTSARLARIGTERGPVDYPGGVLARDLSTVARLIGAGLETRCYHVRQSGYDTHARQVQEQGQLLRQLDQALDAFLADLEARGLLERTLVLTVSEFGRRVEQCGAGPEAGTDHGAGSLLFLAGGRVRGGLHGKAPDLRRLDAVGNLRHGVDFRRVYATLLEDWLGAPSDAVLGRRWDRLPLLEA